MRYVLPMDVRQLAATAARAARHLGGKSAGGVEAARVGWRGGLVALLALVLACLVGCADEVEQVRTLTWDDLLPEGEVAVPQAVNHAFMPTFDDFPAAVDVGTVAALDGQVVRLPGFVVPLDVTEGKVASLLLVPYFGACIHQPPPPPNQIVHVSFVVPVEVASMYDPVWVTGPMRVETYSGALAEASYVMDGRVVEPYEY